MAAKTLSIEPLIDPSAKLHETKLGAYCEVGARTILNLKQAAPYLSDPDARIRIEIGKSPIVSAVSKYCA